MDKSGDKHPFLGITIMLLGEFTHNIDTKKRLAIPAKFRKEVGNTVVITRGLDNCLFIFTKTEWKKLADKIGALPLGQSDARGFARLMLAGAMEVSVDGLGRILIPDYLKKYASLKKQVVVTGVYTRIEVWDEKIWNIYKNKSEKNAEDMAERLGELGV